MKIEVFVFLFCCFWGIAPFEGVSIGVASFINGRLKKFRKTLAFIVMFSYANLYSIGMVISGYVISQDSTIKHYLEKLPEIDLSTSGEIVNHILIFALTPIPLMKKFSIARCVLDFRLSTILCLIAGNAVHTYYIVILGIGFLRFSKKIIKLFRKLWI